MHRPRQKRDNNVTGLHKLLELASLRSIASVERNGGAVWQAFNQLFGSCHRTGGHTVGEGEGEKGGKEKKKKTWV